MKAQHNAERVTRLQTNLVQCCDAFVNNLRHEAGEIHTLPSLSLRASLTARDSREGGSGAAVIKKSGTFWPCTVPLQYEKVSRFWVKLKERHENWEARRRPSLRTSLICCRLLTQSLSWSGLYGAANDGGAAKPSIAGHGTSPPRSLAEQVECGLALVN